MSIKETCRCGASRSVHFPDETAEVELMAIRAWRRNHYCDRPGKAVVSDERDALAEYLLIRDGKS